MLRVTLRAATNAAKVVGEDVSREVVGRLVYRWRNRWLWRKPPTAASAADVAELGLCEAAAQACSTLHFHAVLLEDVLSQNDPTTPTTVLPTCVTRPLAYASGLAVMALWAAQHTFAERADELREQDPDQALQEEFGGPKAVNLDDLGVLSGVHCAEEFGRGGIFE